MTMFTTLALGLMCLAGINDVTALGDVGCLFDPSVCLDEELCLNDKVFGRCQVRGSSPPFETTRPLMATSRPIVERELTRLLAGGYRWSNRYTQCVVQNLLHTERNSLKYDPGLCSRLLHLTVPEVAKEIIRDLEEMEPEEQALIRFRPSLVEEYPEFADELFQPLDKEIGEQMKQDVQEEAFRLGQMLTKRSRQGHTDNTDDPDAWLAPLADAWVQIAEESTSADRLPDPETPVVRTDLSSDLTLRPAFTEGGTQWLEIPADEATEEILAETPQFNTGHSQREDDIDRYERKNDVDFVSATTDGDTSRQAEAAFWRDVNGGKSYKEPEPEVEPTLSPFEEAALVGERELVQALDKAEEDLWRPMVETTEDEENEAEGGGDGSEEDSGPPDMSPFSRPMRYDIKKPGPGYYVHEPEEDTQQAQENQMLALLRSAQREQEEKQWESYSRALKPEGFRGSGPTKDLTADEVNDEETTLQDLVRFDADPRPLPLKAAAPSIQEDKRERISPARSGPNHPEPVSHSQAEQLPHPLKEQLELVDTTQAYLLLQEDDIPPEAGERLVRRLERLLALPRGVFSNIRTDSDRVIFKVNPNAQHLNASAVAKEAEMLAEDLKRSEGLTVLAAGIGEKGQLDVVRQASNDRRLFILTFVLCGSVVGILLAVSVVYLVRKHARSRQKLQNLAQPDSEPSQDYQDLCRQRMQRKGSEKPEAVHRSSLPTSGTGQAHQPKRVSSLSQSENSQASPSSRSSTSSWSEEPVTSNMDISTGHMILSYMEDHLKNRDRLEREWEALCAYEAEPCSTAAATQPLNVNKNRYPDVLPYDHSRVVLNDLTNFSASDYINASTITDHDPRNPAYIATQGPLPHTATDFWQMIWEQGSVVVVTLSRLMENGVALCHRYWPEEGSEVYHIYEVHLVSEHIWCDDYLVRSFYLKNVKTSETRTVTQFHFLSWPESGVPASTKALLEFRRKVNKSYRGRSCPIVVHCSDGSGRTGTYCLIDMVLNRMAKGAKEIDIAATLEHIRDQREGMVKTQSQFEFVLMAIAEEVHAILKALSN